MHSLNILFVKNCHNELKFKTISFVLFYIELTLNYIGKIEIPHEETELTEEEKAQQEKERIRLEKKRACNRKYMARKREEIRRERNKAI